MRTEKETIKDTLIKWGVIKDGKFLKDVFEKEVGASWMRKKIFEYGLDKEIPDTDEPLKLVPENVCSKCGKNPCECEVEPAPVEEIKDETPAEAHVEEIKDETHTEAPVEEVKDDTPAEDSKKKSSKKK